MRESDALQNSRCSSASLRSYYARGRHRRIDTGMGPKATSRRGTNHRTSLRARHSRSIFGEIDEFFNQPLQCVVKIVMLSAQEIRRTADALCTTIIELGDCMRHARTALPLLLLPILLGCSAAPISDPTVSAMPVAHTRQIDRQDAYGRTALIHAVNARNLAMVRDLIARGASVNAADKTGMSPLMVAIRANSRAMVQLLLDNGAAVRARTHIGHTPLMIAAAHGRSEIAGMLISSGADINARSAENDTALILAAMYNRTETARRLIAYGANINAREMNGITALMMAADGGDLALVQVLLVRGAEVNATTIGGESAVQLAADKGYKSIVQLLQNAGATALHDDQPTQVLT